MMTICSICRKPMAPGGFHDCDSNRRNLGLDKPAHEPTSICAKTLTTALELTGGDRAKTHGDKRQNHQNIADLWNAYFADKLIKSPSEPFQAVDVALMMLLVKVARTKSGTHNPDNFVDMAGYAGVAAECADHE